MSTATIGDAVTYRRNQLVFERLRQSLAQRIGAFTAGSTELEVYVDNALNAMVYTLQTDLLAQKLADDRYKAHFSFQVPKTWWQHFKRDMLPKWFVERYPVVYETIHQAKTVRFTRYATYPMANIAMPKNLRTIEFLGEPEIIKDVVSEE